MSSRQVPLQHRLAGALRLGRAALLGATALQALPAAAQPAPNARPTGGVVAAGNASIGFAGNNTAITQSSPRAAIDWRSFNVGSNQRVTFNQPSSSAVALNTVTGPDPSQIAGRIDANGQVIIANRSGVVFSQGSEVNAQSLVVSAAGISRQNFIAGKLVLDQAPQPGARIVNQGTITVKQAGLAALVAPEVANSGVINAKFGHVVLAGAEAATLDLYGDRLVSVDVTKAVRKVRTAGGQTVTALVTNTGVIAADGGTVQLTAAAADGIVTNLVNAGGTIHANTVNGHAGTIAINGTGGSILIEGSVAAEGRSAGSVGGAIEINADHAVTLAGNARVSASGRAGGGVIAIGTTLARAVGGRSATPTMTARQTRISKGAKITADAMANGNGGRVTVLSTERTDFAGTITARGGASGGNGGTVEISSGQGLGLTGTADVCAPQGACGEILLDPANLTIVTTGTSDGLLHGGDPTLAFTDGGTLSDASISANILLQFSGNIHLQATDDITVAANVTLAGTPGSAPSLELEAGGNIRVNPGISISAVGQIIFIAGSTLAPGGGNAAAGIFLGAGSSVSVPTSTLSLTSGTGGISFGGDVNAGIISINSAGVVTQPGGVITTGTVAGQSSALTLGQPNHIAEIGTYTVTSGGLTLAEAPGVALDMLTPIGAAASGQTVSIVADTATFDADSVFLLAAPRGTIEFAPVTAGRPVELSSTLNPAALSLLTTSLQLISAGTLRLGSATAGQVTLGVPGDTIDFGTGGTAFANTLDLRSGAGVVETAAALVVDAVSGNAASATLGAAGNVIGTLGSFTTGGGFALINGGDLIVAGPVTDGTSVNLNVVGALAIDGGVSAPTVGLIATGAITEPGGAITASSLSGSAASVDLTGANSIAAITNFAAVSGATPGAFAFTDTQSVVVSGTVSGDLSISTSGNLTINTGLIQSPGTVALTVGGTIAEVSGGIISAGLLTGSAGSGALDQPNFVATVGPFATGKGFDLVNSAPLTVAGPVSDGVRAAITSSGPLTVAGSITAPTVLLTALPALIVPKPNPASGTITQTAGTIAGSTLIGLSATGTISQAGGLIIAGLLTGNSGGATTLTSAANAVAQLGDFASDGDFALATGGNLALTGALTAPDATLTAAGAISQPSGLIATGTLTGAGGAASFAAAGNTVTALGGFAAAGDFLLADAAPVTIAGTVTAGTGRTLTIADNAPAFGAAGLLDAPAGTVALAPLTAGTSITLGGGGGIGGSPPVIAHELIVGSANAGPITIAGAFNLAVVDELDLISGDAIAETGAGAIAVPVLTGQGASATLTAGNAIGTLASFTTTGGYALADTIGLTLQGTLSAGRASVGAPGITLAGDALLLGSGGASLTVLPGTGGLGRFGQTGTTTVVRLGAATTVSVTLPAAGGTIAFANLVASGAGLVLTTGAGTASGHINVGSLLVIGSTGASDLFGAVAGVSGTPAAAIARIQPTIDPHYLLNNCVIESASCGLGQLPQFPDPKLFAWQDQNGIQQLSAAAIAAMLTLPTMQVVRQPRDPDIELPNISNLDY